MEWAHAVAPEANIVLVEANDDDVADIVAAVNTARNLPQVSVVSMSFIFWQDTVGSAQLQYDSDFTTPAGHAPITFVAATGDYAAPKGFPACSPNVLAVGGFRSLSR